MTNERKIRNLAESDRRLLMDRSVPGRSAITFPEIGVPEQLLPPKELLREDVNLPELSQLEVVRYFTRLSQLNYSVDTNFYPLGSCTMKYNPKINDQVASIPGLAFLHPMSMEEASQGALKLLYQLQGYLEEITGMKAVSLAPMAGAQAELAGILTIRAYHLDRKDHGRRVMLIPDSAHGTNPSSAAMAGFHVASIPSDSKGNIDIKMLKRMVGNDLAGIMLTLPTTLGLFEPEIAEIARIIHEAGGLVYGDGANMNALLGQVKMGSLGFDVMHLNLHKTFSTPHGGGGPGAGPLCVGDKLALYIPSPVVVRLDVNEKERFSFVRPERSIGKVGAFHGNFGVLVRAYAYIRTLGADGLKQISEDAVLNANYLMTRLKDKYDVSYDRVCMHEVVLSARKQKERGVRGIDIAKRLLDYGFHAPTMYFPLIVDEALMIEPTETETKETLDDFIDALLAIDQETMVTPELVTGAPYTTPVSRLDEVLAARKPDLGWKPLND
jgi:glycine dehydrogenase subunit 2